MTTDNVRPLTGKDRAAAMAPTTEAEVLAEPWPEVLPFQEAEPPPPFPVESLPPVLARFVTEMAASMGTSPDLVASCVLAAVSTVAGGRWIVPASWRLDWREQLVLFIAAVAPPGSMKSAAMAAASRPVAELQRELIDRLSVEVEEAALRRRIDDKALAKLETLAAEKPNGPEDYREQAADLARDLAARPVPVVPSLHSADITTEKLEDVIAANGGHHALLDAEGGVFTMLSGRYAARAGGVSIDVYLKGYSGDGLDVKRMGRPTVSIERVALTVGITTQPAHLQAALHNVEGGVGRGLFDRFLFVWPDLSPVDRSQPTTPVSPEVVRQYAAMVKGLYAVAESIPAAEPRILDMDPDAADALQAFARWAHEAVLTGGDLDAEATKGWAEKLPGQVLRLAGLLAVARNPRAVSIDLDSATGAVTLGHYFVAHALRAFREVDIYPEVVEARKCWKAIQEARPTLTRWKEWPEVVTTRDVLESVKGTKALSTADAVEAALTRLTTEYHLLRGPTKGKGGQQRWEVHPDHRPER